VNDIPPQEFGYLQATVDKLEDRVEKLTVAVEALTATLNQTKGGWKLLVALGGIVSFATVVVLKLFGFIKGY
jgi:tetrahydromethanopterin S-methyltransferase subunit B